MKKILIGVAFVVVLAIIVGVNLAKNRSKGAEVDVTEIGRKDLVAEVSGSGRIQAKRSVSVTSSVVGKVVEVAVEEGDRVEKGQLILRVDSGQQRSALVQARASLARARARERLSEAELRKADFELVRIRDLKANGLASDQDLQAAETNAEVQLARLQEAREDVRNASAGVDRADYDLDKTVVRAELSGVVVLLTVEEGENVLAGDLYNAGSPIVTVADLSTMEAHVLVDETEVVSLARGQEATVTVDAFPDRQLRGRVTEVGNSAYNAGPLGSQEAKDFRVRVLLEEVPENFRPGLSARAEIVTDRRAHALAVPIAALTIRDPDRERWGSRRSKRGRSRPEEPEESGPAQEIEGVLVVQAGKAEFAAVVTGIAGESDFEVLEGLSDGDLVIHGPFEAIRNLESGESVKIRKRRRGGAAESAPEDPAEPRPAVEARTRGAGASHESGDA